MRPDRPMLKLFSFSQIRNKRSTDPSLSLSTDSCNGHSNPFRQGHFDTGTGSPFFEPMIRKKKKEKGWDKAPLVKLLFSPEDLALATLPGAEFNPRERAFHPEELKPQPIIRKRPKIFVTNDSKDEQYWVKRIKNNIAAKR